MTTLLRFLVLGICSASLAAVAVVQARQQRLSVRYASGWVALAFLGLGASVLVPLASPLAQSLAVAPGMVVSGAAVIVLIGLSLQLSVSVSGVLRQTERLAISLALSGRSIERYCDDDLVIVPAFNEAHNVGVVVSSLRLEGLTVVVIDDGSSDNTGEIASRAGAIVLAMPFNLGVGAAIRCGLHFAVQCGAKRVIQCDADGQHPVESIADLLRCADETRADLVIGSRFSGGEAPRMTLSRSRRSAMKVLAGLVSQATGESISDATSGFRVISEPLLSQLASNMPSYYLGDTFETYMAAGRSGYTVVEVHTPIRERLSGSSSASVWSSIMMIAKAMFLVTTRLGIRLPQRPNTTR